MSAEPLYTYLAAVKDEPTFLRFVGLLAAKDGMESPGSSVKTNWANQTIEDFVIAAGAWMKDAQASDTQGPNQSDLWKLLAKYLLAGHGYEQR